jgi:AcrR family transcriptional regulator
MLAAHVLREGLAAASLRPLAAAAGTSDRMLLYYFANKGDLVGAVLERIAGQLRDQLNAAVPEPLPYPELGPTLIRLVRAPGMKPYLQIWLELAARSGRSEEPFRAVAGAISDGFLQWTASRLRMERGRERQRMNHAASLLCLVEAVVLFDAMGREAIGDQAAVSLLPCAARKLARPTGPR